MTAALTLRLVKNLALIDSIKAYFEPFLQLVWPMWRADAFRTKVIEVRPELAGVYTLVLKPSKRWQGFKAGQHIEIVVEHQGARVNRFFSISSSPAYFQQTGLIELSIRVQEKGRITPWLAGYKNNNRFNDYLSISAAQGDFTLLTNKQPQLWIAGGSGITPFRSMLQQLKYRSIKQDVHLLYYVQAADQTLFKNELLENAQTLGSVKVTLLNDQEHGYLSKQHLHSNCDDIQSRQVFICGPKPMIALARTYIEELGVNKDQIHFEYFGAAPIDLPRNFASSSVVTFSRSTVTAEVNNEQPQSLLEVAEESGLRPVSGCRMGVCHQCVCQKSSGRVLNTLTGAYSDSGAGEIQLCISVACDDVVIEL